MGVDVPTDAASLLKLVGALLSLLVTAVVGTAGAMQYVGSTVEAAVAPVAAAAVTHITRDEYRDRLASIENRLEKVDAKIDLVLREVQRR